MSGHIEPRGETFRLVYFGGYDQNGKKIRHYKTLPKGTSEREAKKQLAMFIAENEKGDYIAPVKFTFAEYSNYWLEKYAKNKVQITTLETYQWLLKRPLEAFGHLRIDKIIPRVFVDFFSNLSETGIREDRRNGVLSSRTLLHYYRLLSKMFNDAVTWELISRNPLSKVEPPKVQYEEAEYYTEDEIETILEKLLDEELKYQVLTILAIVTGARRGELCGLEWKHVNFEKMEISIRQSSAYTKSKGIITKEPKSKGSKRTISIPHTVINLLKEFKDLQDEIRLKLGDAWVDHDRLFTQWNGKPISPGTSNDWFQEFLRRNNLPKKTFHSLRHTNATLLIAEGINIKNVSQRLGHSDIEITLRTYAHALEKVDKVAAEKMGNIISKIASPVLQNEEA